MHKITPKMKEVAKLLGVDILEVISAEYGVVVDFLVLKELDKGNVASMRAQELSEIANIPEIITRCIQTRDFALADELNAGKITEKYMQEVIDLDRAENKEMLLRNEEPDVEVIISAYSFSKDKLKELFVLLVNPHKKAEVIKGLIMEM